ncbi:MULTISPECIES: hypothetical protein [unclassified Acinetobacter]|uniref:hypothetical protein n=1 Tax=unclassified Acinetobacter TaxID=196816 RepID=UPI0029345D9A|nr:MULTISPECIES: hypothetical protein [unclassified Acinetobacter]WOE31408.1 hypothetical protein QSG84_13980 [Acinetobacter sp. SAAs470]WOE39604.1 hypothetical protein QSG86_07645 [Acinetobacter sp. SAAs474]
MKQKLLFLALSGLLITGCASTPPSNPSNIGTFGLLICQENELCPIVTVSWNESNKDLLKVRISLNSAQNKYEIEKVAFSNGKTNIAFNVLDATKIDFVGRVYRSNNSIQIPRHLMEQFKGSHTISMQIYTNHGVISRYILKDGQEAPVYKELTELYPIQP